MNDTNKYSIISYPSSRLFTMDIGILGSNKHHIKVLVEFDVTNSLNKIKAAKSNLNNKISFTSWILKCISISLDNNKQVHALKKGRNKLFLFNDTDISIVIEKNINNILVPIPYVLREVNNKTIKQIYEEIEIAKNVELNDKMLDFNKSNKYMLNIFSYFPQFVRLFFWNIILRNPIRVKKLMGTSLFTSVGMFGHMPGWAIPFSIHPISFTLGSITKKSSVINDSTEIRDILHMTLLFDHDVIDGAPAARFMTYLKELIENGHGL